MPLTADATVSELAVQIALARAGVPIKERGGRNRGTEIDRYHEQVGLKKEDGHPWCCSGLYDAFLEASRVRGVACPFPKTAKAVRVWEVLYGSCLESNPERGFVYVLDHGKPGDILTEWKNDRYTSKGHIGVVLAVNNGRTPIEVEVPDVVAALLGVPAPGRMYTVPPGSMLEISANTNAQGSREGDRWAVHAGTPEVSHGGILLGYLNLERVVQYTQRKETS